MNKFYIFFVLILNVSIGLSKEKQCERQSKDVFDYDVAQIHKDQKQAIITRPAPYWEGKGAHMGKIKDFKLTDFLGQYLIMLFYPLDFTFVCPTEIIAFHEKYEDFKKLNTEIVALSVDSVYTHLAFMNTPKTEGGLGEISIPLISDTNHEISKTYGVYMENMGHTLRGMFIIDKKGILRQITINDTPVGRNVEEAYRLIQAFQYTDEHQEVCPAGWKKPGDPTITPNPHEKKKYFQKQAHHH